MKNFALIFGLLSLLCFGDSSFSEPTALSLGLKILVQDDQVRRSESCVQSFLIADDADGLYVYWPENRMLIVFPRFDENDPAWEEPLLIARMIDLEKDVVANEESIGSSTYLETLDFVKSRVRACYLGERFLTFRVPNGSTAP